IQIEHARGAKRVPQAAAQRRLPLTLIETVGELGVDALPRKVETGANALFDGGSAGEIAVVAERAGLAIRGDDAVLVEGAAERRALPELQLAEDYVRVRLLVAIDEYVLDNRLGAFLNAERHL